MLDCVAVRHVAFEDLGLIAALLDERGFAVRYLDAGVDPIDDDTLSTPDLVVVLGGPIGVYDGDNYPLLAPEIAAIAARLARRAPTLGICLGAQLMAKALGADVRPGPRKEIGWAPVELTDAGRASVLATIDGVPVLHWHGDNFDLPVGATRLASTAVCPHQAFSVGRHALGLQFHVEAEPGRIERWLIGHCCELTQAGINPRDLRRDAARFGDATAAAGHKVISAWLDQ